MNKTTIWLWQQMVTPHMAVLADALAGRGIPVVYVANERDDCRTGVTRVGRPITQVCGSG